MNNWIFVLLAIGANVIAQALMKLNGINSGESALSTIFSVKVIWSIVAYGISFILGLFVYKYNELSVAGPVMTSLTCLLVFAVACIFFHESITISKSIGITFLVVGLIFITR